MLGTNESQLDGLTMERHGRDYAAMLARLRAGAPDAACLVMSPPDRAARTGSGRMITRPVIPQIVERQRQVAFEAGCGFFNTFEVMGGSGSAARWREERPVLMGGDLTHPTGEGAVLLGTRLYEALTEGYRSSPADPPERPAAAEPSTGSGSSR
jgi:lysophospholipase L1-like esterase